MPSMAPRSMMTTSRFSPGAAASTTGVTSGEAARQHAAPSARASSARRLRPAGGSVAHRRLNSGDASTSAMPSQRSAAPRASEARLVAARRRQGRSLTKARGSTCSAIAAASRDAQSIRAVSPGGEIQASASSGQPFGLRRPPDRLVHPPERGDGSRRAGAVGSLGGSRGRRRAARPRRSRKAGAPWRRARASSPDDRAAPRRRPSGRPAVRGPGLVEMGDKVGSGVSDDEVDRELASRCAAPSPDAARDPRAPRRCRQPRASPPP